MAQPQACLSIKLQQQVAGRCAAAKGQLHDAVDTQLLHSFQPARPAGSGEAGFVTSGQGLTQLSWLQVNSQRQHHPRLSMQHNQPCPEVSETILTSVLVPITSLT